MIFTHHASGKVCTVGCAAIEIPVLSSVSTSLYHKSEVKAKALIGHIMDFPVYFSQGPVSQRPLCHLCRRCKRPPLAPMRHKRMQGLVGAVYLGRSSGLTDLSDQEPSESERSDDAIIIRCRVDGCDKGCHRNDRMSTHKSPELWIRSYRMIKHSSYRSTQSPVRQLDSNQPVRLGGTA